MSENVQLYMEPEEIKTRYLQAYDRKSQIGILADLNACSKREIEKVLEEQGVDLNHYVESRKAWWTADEDALLRDLWAKGYGIKEIADVMCRTEKAVANRRHRLHLTKDGQKKEDVMTGEEGAMMEEKIPRGSAPRNDTEGDSARMEERFLADARDDTEDDAQEDAEKDVVDLIKAAVELIRKEAAETVQASAEEAAGARIPRSARNDTEEDGVQDDGYAVAGTLEAGGPVLSAEGMLRLVFRAVSTQLNSYMEDGDDKEPTLADLLSSVGLLALRYFDEGGRTND